MQNQPMTSYRLICSLIPRSFTTSATGALSTSLRIVTICSSVSRLSFMTFFLRWKPFSQVSTGPKITWPVQVFRHDRPLLE